MSYTFPTLEKNWSFQVNQPILKQSSLNNLRYNFVFLLKKSLVESGNWSVISSSNSITTSQSDLWNESLLASWLSGSSINGCWIVLRNIAIDPTNQKFDLCIHFYAGAASLYISPFGYNVSSGTILSRPQSLLGVSYPGNTDEIYVSGVSSLDMNENSYVHFISSNDGQCTRIVGTTLGKLKFFLIIDKIRSSVNNISLFPIPFVCFTSTSSAGLNLATLAINSYPTFFTPANPNSYGTIFTRFLQGSNKIIPLFGYPSDFFHTNNVINNLLQLSKIKIYSFTHGIDGNIGEFYDLWKAPVSVPNGCILNSSTSQGKLIVFSELNGGQYYDSGKFNLTLPWNNSTPLI